MLQYRADLQLDRNRSAAWRLGLDIENQVDPAIAVGARRVEEILAVSLACRPHPADDGGYLCGTRAALDHHAHADDIGEVRESVAVFSLGALAPDLGSDARGFLDPHGERPARIGVRPEVLAPSLLDAVDTEQDALADIGVIRRVRELGHGNTARITTSRVHALGNIVRLGNAPSSPRARSA